MERILVPTDFSSQSTAAIRLAIQLADQGNYKPCFLHVTEILKPTSWSDEAYADFERKELEQTRFNLNQFVSGVYESSGKDLIELDCVANNGSTASQNIMNYAEENSFSYICTGHKGGGNTLQLFGSTTSALFEKSNVPVIAVPDNYTINEITSVCYAADLINVDDELEKVVRFTKPLDTKVELVHFKGAGDLTNQENLERLRKQLADHHINARFEVVDYENSLVQKLAQIIDESKPSMLVMFTEQKRSFFDRIFLSSKSSELAMSSKIPVLVFKK